MAASNISSASAGSAAKSLKSALAVLQANVMRTGRGFKEYWYVSAAYGFIQAETAPNEQMKREHERDAWERVAVLCYRILATRKPSGVEKDILLQPDLVVRNHLHLHISAK